MEKQPSKISSYLFPTIGDMLWMAVFWGVLIYGQRMINADGDFALHLSMGRFILNHRNIPLQDVFSHTLAGQPAAQHKWLAQLLFAQAERMLGFGGVILLCALAISTAFWLVYKRARKECSTLSVAVFILLIALVVSMIHWLIRPHVFTFLFLAIWMIVLKRLRDGNLKSWWLLPVLMIFWVNLHGGFIAGFVTWFIYGLGIAWDALWGRITPVKKFWRIYVLGGVSALGASLINPTGIGLWNLIITHLGNRYLAAVTVEFWSPNFHKADFWPFMIMIGLMVALVDLNKEDIDSGLLLNAVAWLFMGLYSARNIPLFAIVSAPLLVHGLDRFFIKTASRFEFIGRLKRVDDRILNVDVRLKGYVLPALSILFAVLGLSLGLRFDAQGQGYRFDPEVFPVAAVDWLEENPQEGEMFNYFTWGGYLQYRLWPEKRVFIDSNSDFYGEAFVRQYIQVIMLQEGWEDVLDQYDVTWAILPLNESAAGALQSVLDWGVIYEDETAVILVRE
jgi:hypothetical protein